MSQAKVVEVAHARAAYRCEKDGTEIAKGDPYRWYVVGFRSKHRHIRCMKASCTPRPSERESSQLSEVYAAQEDAVANIDSSEQNAIIEDPSEGEGLIEEIRGHLQTAADSIREVGQAYRDADENFGGGGMTEMGEKADTLDEAADSLDSWEPDRGAEDIDGCGEHEDDDALSNGYDPKCEDCQDGLREWVSEVATSARDLVNEIDLP